MSTRHPADNAATTGAPASRADLARVFARLLTEHALHTPGTALAEWSDGEGCVRLWEHVLGHGQVHPDGQGVWIEHDGTPEQTETVFFLHIDHPATPLRWLHKQYHGYARLQKFRETTPVVLFVFTDTDREEKTRAVLATSPLAGHVPAATAVFQHDISPTDWPWLIVGGEDDDFYTLSDLANVPPPTRDHY